jgi:predicted ribosomally synthesized peptide with SipW-like signal peptide
MTRLNYGLTTILLLLLNLLGIQTTYSYFSNSATSSNNVFAAAAAFPTPSNTPSPTLSPGSTSIVINEVSSSTTDEWVELYNKSLVTIDVSGWKISDNNALDIFPSSSPIPAGGYAIVRGTASNPTGIPGSAIIITLSDSQIGNGLNNSGDRLQLKNSSDTIIDQVNYGSDTLIFNPAPSAPNSTQSLARMPNGTDTDTSTNWQIDNTPSIGVTN